MDDTNERLRALPAVDALLHTSQGEALVASAGRDLAVDALRSALAEARESILAGAACPATLDLLARALSLAGAAGEPTLHPVINATGVILHTNLGRAPLSAAVLEAMRRAASGYSNLEYDLAAGSRGSRYVHAESLLRRLTGAEAALVVNNNAGAVLLVLSALARDREVVISRGQLVEIGGGFRIPDVMAQSGADLVEVGTTNRTYLQDYGCAIGERTVALLRVHTSNYRMEGFVHQAPLRDLAELAHGRGLLCLEDLGSGTLLDTARYGLHHEPTVPESLADGADLVTFSGDKLLGGPQAGMIVGSADLIRRLREHPLTRALRVDKATLAGIQANLLHYLRGEAVEEIPVWRMMSRSAEDIERAARELLAALGSRAEGCEGMPGLSTVGGGSLPGESLPTALLALPAGHAEWLAEQLRSGDPPVIARIQDDRVVLDLRTVADQDLPALGERLAGLL